MRSLVLLAAVVLIGCATGPRPGPAATLDIARQRAQVDAALAPLNAERTAREADFERAFAAGGDDRDRALDDLLADLGAKERAILEPLAAVGNAEAAFRLSIRLRDAESAADVRRWYELVNAASELGHPGADEELVRWYWHQRGDGSIHAVQRNRALAVEYAERATRQGSFFGIRRIAVYIAGDVHQYPANRPLARRLLELCARAGDRDCVESLTSQRPYDYRLTPAEAAAVRNQAATRPVSWSQLRPEWLELRAAILAHGQSSVGRDAACVTMTPWCRGQYVTAEPR